MTSLTLQAPAKVNLTLDILGARPDGYHEMEMVMQSVSLCDAVTLDLGDPGGIRAESGLHFLPKDKDNLAVAAALAFREAAGQDWQDLRITIQKEIPVCAGTAGGSSDAAAVLRGLNTLTGAGFSPQELARVGEAVGSDVPYCVLGGTALAQGRGEILTPLKPLPPCHIVLCKPVFFHLHPRPVPGVGQAEAPPPAGHPRGHGRPGPGRPGSSGPPDVQRL